MVYQRFIGSSSFSPSAWTQFGNGDCTTPSHLPEPCFADYEAFEVEDLDNGEEGKGAESYTPIIDVYQKVRDPQDRCR